MLTFAITDAKSEFHLDVINVGQESPCESCVSCDTVGSGWYDRYILYEGAEPRTLKTNEVLWAGNILGNIGDVKIQAYFRYKLDRNCPIPGEYTLMINIYRICFDFVTPSDTNTIPNLSVLLKREQQAIMQYIYFYFSSIRFGSKEEEEWFNKFMYNTDINKKINNNIEFIIPCSFYRTDISNPNGPGLKGACYEPCSYNCCKILYSFETVFDHRRNDDTTKICFNHWKLASRSIDGTSSYDCNQFQSQQCEFICSDSLYAFNIGLELNKDIQFENCDYCLNPFYYKINSSELQLTDMVSMAIVYDLLGNEVTRINCYDENCTQLNKIALKGLYFIRLYDKNNKILKSVSRFFE
jgi:hypothetical protein